VCLGQEKQPTTNNQQQQQTKRKSTQSFEHENPFLFPKMYVQLKNKQKNSLGLSTHCLAVCMTSTALPMDVSTQLQGVKALPFLWWSQQSKN